MQEEMDNVSRKLETLRKNQKEVPDTKNTDKIKNAFNGQISRLEATEDSI